MQQSHPGRGGRHVEQPDSVTNFLNAPTSLANLAQLSGISLVPVSDVRPTLNISANNSQFITFDGQQPPKIITGTSRHATIMNGRQTTANSYPQYAPPVYNLETIPSIQLLNRVTADQQQQASASHSRSKQRDVPRGAQHSGTHSGNKRSRSHNQPTATRTMPIGLDSRAQILPINQSLSPGSVSNSTSSLQPSDISSLLSRDSHMSTESNDEQMSLLKLMAILNNPALTLTPVGPTHPSFEAALDRDVSPWMHLNRSQQRSPAGQAQNDLDIDAQGSIDLQQHETDVQMMAEELVAGPQDVGRGDEPPMGEVQAAETDEQHTITLSWPSQNMDEEQSTLTSKSAGEFHSTTRLDPARMIQDFVEATERSDPNSFDQDSAELPLESHCILPGRAINFKPLENLAKCKDIVYWVASDKSTDAVRSKVPIRSTKRRLYLPSVSDQPAKRLKLQQCMRDIRVEAAEQTGETLISEHHLVLSKIAEIAESVGQERMGTLEPDDIFVEKSKRIMSVIDTKLEKKRMRKFEKITQSSGQDGVDGDSSSDESESEVLYGCLRPEIDPRTVVPIQLPLEETLNDCKRDHLSSVGLISRADKHEMIASLSEKRFNKISPLIGDVNYIFQADEDVRRIVATLVKTGGRDIDLRTETDIKRIELPFIEGLNRNTSRIKMTYMNALGLEKKSKRTTLYKVVKPQEVPAAERESKLPSSNDLKSNSTKKSVQNNSQQVSTTAPTATAVTHTRAPGSNTQSSSVSQVQPMKLNGMSSSNASGGSAEILRKAMRLAQASCREALYKQPNKDEYMKSLGLMAS